MNWDRVEGNWKQLTGKVKEQWGKLTDDDLLAIALDDADVGWTPDDGPKEVLAQATAEFLLSKADMLAEYFGIVLDADAAALIAIPQLLPGYLPPLWALPRFLLTLGTAVDWTAELACFSTFLAALADFYALSPAQRLDDSVLPGGQTSLAWAIEHTLFPALRTAFHPSSDFATNGAVLQVAHLHDLYKVFERC